MFDNIISKIMPLAIAKGVFIAYRYVQGEIYHIPYPKNRTKSECEEGRNCIEPSNYGQALDLLVLPS